MTIDALAHRFYLHGYQRRDFPRAFRRVLARSPLHRAWLAGWHGYFTDVDTGESYGLTRPATPRTDHT